MSEQLTSIRRIAIVASEGVFGGRPACGREVVRVRVRARVRIRVKVKVGQA